MVTEPRVAERRLDHYLKILDFLEGYLPPDLAGEHWRQELFRDLTEDGRVLTVVPLPANDSGPRIGLCGDRAFCEAGLDRSRKDTLFLMRVEPADHRLPRTEPKKYEANLSTFALHGSNPQLDPVEQLFGISDRPKDAESNGSRKAAEPSAALIQILQDLPEDVRSPWRPRVLQEVDDRSLILRLREIWTRLELESVLAATEREKKILGGGVTPSELKPEERLDLLALFGVGALNQAIRQGRQKLVTPLLKEQASLPLSPSIRSLIWCSSLTNMDPTALRSELKAASQGLHEVVKCPEYAQELEQRLIDALRRMSESKGDRLLAEHLDELGDGPKLLQIAAWATDVITTERGLSHDEKQKDHENGLQETRTDLAEEETPIELDRTPMPDYFESWLVRALFGGEENLLRSRENAETLVQALSRFTGQPESVDSLLELIRSGHVFEIHKKSVADSLPTVRQIESLLESSSRALERLLEACDESSVRRLLECSPSTDALEEISLLVEPAGLLSVLPRWIFDAAEDEETNESRLLLLLGKQCRAVLRPIVEALRSSFPDTDLRLRVAGALKDVEHRPEEPFGERAQRAVHDIRSLATRLEDLSEAARDLALSALSHRSGLDDVFQILDELAALSRFVPSEVLEQILERVRASETSLVKELESWAEAAEFIVTSFGPTAPISLDLLERRRNVYQASPAIRRASAESETSVQIRHNTCDQSGRRVSLTFDPEPDAPYGWVRVPCLLTTDEPRSLNVVVVPRITSKLAEAWPSDWPAPQPLQVHISRSEWRPSEGAGRSNYSYAIRFNLPIRRPPDLTPLSVAISIRSGEGEVLTTRTLDFDTFEPEFSPVSLSWPEGINPTYVSHHPIGPQESHELLEQRLRNGSSFAVVAPRRYGKTTLVHFLQQVGLEAGFLVAEPIQCTSYLKGDSLDYREFWRDISQKLQDRLGSALTGISDDPVPSPEAFDHVRRAAKAKGHPSIVLLLDEAQLFFPRASGTQIGDQLKDRLETSWAAQGRGTSSVVLGLVGLPSIVERGGANLMGHLRPLEGRIEERALNTLILRLTEGKLQTTRDARIELARCSVNLLVLRTLVELLQSHVNRDRRRWLQLEDVVNVRDDLRRRLLEGEERTIGESMRDIFNEALTVNDWKPIPAYPSAVALAVAGHELGGGSPSTAVRSRALEILQGWCDDLAGSSDDTGQRSVYTPRTLDRHMATLREMGVLRDEAFQSDLLQAWLVGAGIRGLNAPEEAALQAGSLLLLRRPRSLDPVSVRDSGQAKIFQFEEEGERFAWREVRIPEDEDARDRFLLEANVLQILKSARFRRERGADSIVDLRHVGLVEGASDLAVQVYHWVDGRDLGQKRAELAEALVVDIGLALTRALAALHRFNILHRDISPQNVVLREEDAVPVLIDFGLARLADRELTTVVDSEFTAPEARSTTPEWSPAADIYSLAATLRYAARDPSPTLTGLLNRCLDEKHERPTAEELLESLEEMSLDLEIAGKKAEHRASIYRALDEAEPHWYRTVVDKHVPSLIAVMMGLHKDPIVRGAALADFFNQILEARPGAERLSLGKVKHQDQLAGVLALPCISIAHKLRLFGSHGSVHRAAVESLIHQYGYSDVSSPLSESAEKIGEFLGVNSLVRLTKLVFGETDDA